MEALAGTGEDGIVVSRWISQKERGAEWTIRFMVWLSRRKFRFATDVLLYPIVLYFLIVAGESRKASRQFFERATGQFSLLDHYRQLMCFARSLVDRVAILSGEADSFEVIPHGREQLFEVRRKSQGLIMLGAHLGSFEAARVLLKDRADIDVHIVAYFAGSEKIRRALDALNPQLTRNVIDPTAADAIFSMRDVIENGGVLAILGDRVGIGDKTLAVDVLGARALLPSGPYFLASILQCPVYCFFGLRTGAKRYESFVFKLADRIQLDRGHREEQATIYAQRFADLMGEMARMHPDNWFNFFEFWCDPSNS